MRWRSCDPSLQHLTFSLLPKRHKTLTKENQLDTQIVANPTAKTLHNTTPPKTSTSQSEQEMLLDRRCLRFALCCARIASTSGSVRVESLARLKSSDDETTRREQTGDKFVISGRRDLRCKIRNAGCLPSDVHLSSRLVRNVGWYSRLW